MDGTSWLPTQGKKGIVLDVHEPESSKGMLRRGQQALDFLRRALGQLREAALPALCLVCDRRAQGAPLCAGCLGGFAPAQPGAAASAPYAYGGALAEALRQAKFRPDERAARALADLFARAVAPSSLGDVGAIEVVTWVPLHPRRLRFRGFDLAAQFAWALARHHRLPCEPLLRCVRHDLPLSRAADAAERARRVDGRYQALPAAAGRRVLLIDDVVTTGATLREAKRALEAARAASVALLAFAATPRGGGLRRCGETHSLPGSPDHS
ncbi:MAG: ComF family protein [Myxococcota bacterium]